MILKKIPLYIEEILSLCYNISERRLGVFIMFTVAKPIFLKNLNNKNNITAFFCANFDCDGEEGYVSISANQSYKITVNGDFVGYGPSYTDNDRVFIEKFDISKYISFGLNQIVIETAVYSENDDVNNFIQAEIYADKRPVAATGHNFIGFMDIERTPSDENVSESYNISGSSMVQTKLEVYEHNNLLVELKAPEKKYKITSPKEFALLSSDFNEVLKKSSKNICPVIIDNSKLLRVDFGKETFGFIKLAFKTENNAKIKVYTSMEESFSKRDEKHFKIDCINGEYERESFIPHKFRYLFISADNAEILETKVREYK